MNANSPDLGLKSVIDNTKKKILISQTYKDKDLADVVFNMLLYNGVPVEDICIRLECNDRINLDVKKLPQLVVQWWRMHVHYRSII